MQFGEAIKAIKERLDIAEIVRRYVELRPQGGAKFVAPCPFHQETRPSFSVDAGKGFFYCFGCQASGDLISFYARINGLELKEAVAQLADEAGILIDAGAAWGNGKAARAERTQKQAMLAMQNAAADFFAANLVRPQGRECINYLRSRGVPKDISERFGLGWADRDWHTLDQHLKRLGYNPGLAHASGLLGQANSGACYDRFRGRLMFPIRNLSNQVIAFGGRIIADEDEAKYINTSDTPIYSKKDHLYGLSLARRGISAKGHALLTEGYMDVLTLHQFGFDNSVGVLGTALTEEQIKRLSGFTSHIGLLFDGDRAGRKAALRAAEMLLCRGLSCEVILLPEGEDIDSLLKGQGPDAFEKLRSHAPDGLAYCINTLRALAPREAINWARNFISRMQVPELVASYASRLAQKLGISESEFRSNLLPQAGRRTPTENKALLCDRDTQIMVFAVRYPERLEDLRNIGADLALTQQRSREFWDLIERYGPEEVIYHLDERQRKFWQERRNPPSPPLDKAELELSCLKRELDRFYAASHAASLQTALSDGASESDFASDLQYLHAIRDVMRSRNEQS